jgi:hypothetical protein
VPAANPDDFDDLYDDVTLGRFERASRRRGADVARGWRGGLGAGVIATTAMLGVRDVFEPEHRDPVIEEIDLDEFADDDAPVTYHHVVGSPRSSLAIVRPWRFT